MQRGFNGVLAGFCLAVALLLAPCFALAEESIPRPWWRDYHTLLSHSVPKAAKARDLGMMAERGGWSTGWYGLWWVQQNAQRLGQYDAIKHIENFRRQGIRNVFYYDAGEYGEFVGLIANRKLLRSQWELRFYRGEQGRLMWFGHDAFYRDDNPLNLKNYKDFGLRPWTLPDGSRVRSTYDLAQTSLDGKLDPWEYSRVEVTPEIAKAIGLSEFLAEGPDPAPPGAGLGRIRSFDHSNPFLLDEFKAGVDMMLAYKPDFLHFDNYFANQLLYPKQCAFGAWSLHNFQQFMAKNVDRATLKQIGVDSPLTFDLRKYLETKPLASRGKRWFYNDPSWRDDPIWNLFACSKLADSQQLFRALYDHCKQVSRAAGHEVVIASNTIPIFPGESLAGGAIDQVHFEFHTAKQYGPIRKPVGLPPRGKLSGVVRLAASIGSTGYCWPTVYVPKELSGPGHENLHKVIAFDCLANKGVLDFNYQYKEGYSPGSDDSAAWINRYIQQHAAYYGSRQAIADVGVIYPGQTMLASLSIFSMDPEVCLYDYLGWTQALTDLHVQWDVVPDDQVNAKALSRFKVLVLPSADCVSDGMIQHLRIFVDAGGRLILSGKAGSRYGIDRFLWKRPVSAPLGTSIASEKNISRIVVTGSLGSHYHCDDTLPLRRAGLSEIQIAICKAMQDYSGSIELTASSSVGAYTYREDSGGLAIDLVNYQIDPASDRLTAAAPLMLRIHSAAAKTLRDSGFTMISPALKSSVGEYKPTPVDGKRLADGSLQLNIPSFEVFATVRIPAQSSDAWRVR